MLVPCLGFGPCRIAAGLRRRFHGQDPGRDAAHARQPWASATPMASCRCSSPARWTCLVGRHVDGRGRGLGPRRLKPEPPGAVLPHAGQSQLPVASTSPNSFAMAGRLSGNHSPTFCVALTRSSDSATDATRSGSVCEPLQARASGASVFWVQHNDDAVACMQAMTVREWQLQSPPYREPIPMSMTKPILLILSCHGLACSRKPLHWPLPSPATS